MNFILDKTNKKIKELNSEIKTVKKQGNQFIDILSSKVSELKNENDKLKKVKTPEHIRDLIEILYSSSDIVFECPICLDSIANDNFIMTICGHHYCKTCLIELHKLKNVKCAICNATILESINSSTNNINISANI